MQAWNLTPEAFQRLLGALDPDQDRAAEAYERLRTRTIGLLQWWGAADAEALADETFDRVAKKLQEGADVAEASIGAFVRGVARMIFYEARRRSAVQPPDVEWIAPPASGEERTLSCLDSCLASLSARDRDLVLRYYGDGKAADVRRRLAVEVGTTPAALRLRAHRLRTQLERCVSGCAARDETFRPDPTSTSEGIRL